MKIRVMKLTATSQNMERPFELSAEDRKTTEVRKRLNAKKSISLHAIDDEKKLADKLAELALIISGERLLPEGFEQGVQVSLHRRESLGDFPALLRRQVARIHPGYLPSGLDNRLWRYAARKFGKLCISVCRQISG